VSTLAGKVSKLDPLSPRVRTSSPAPLMPSEEADRKASLRARSFFYQTPLFPLLLYTPDQREGEGWLGDHLSCATSCGTKRRITPRFLPPPPPRSLSSLPTNQPESGSSTTVADGLRAFERASGKAREEEEDTAATTAVAVRSRGRQAGLLLVVAKGEETPVLLLLLSLFQRVRYRRVPVRSSSLLLYTLPSTICVDLADGWATTGASTFLAHLAQYARCWLAPDPDGNPLAYRPAGQWCV